MPPLISICLPNLNTRPFLEERMETILAQTEKNWEMIICDSYSDDGSWELFQKFKGDPRIRMYQVPREGIYAGWNECLRRATGEFIYIATSDDTAAPQLLERLLSSLTRFPEINLAVCDYETIDPVGKAIPYPRTNSQRTFYGEWLNVPSIRNGKTEFLLHASLGITYSTITSVLFRRRHLETVGLFRTDQGSYADVEWALRGALISDTVYIPDKLATFRVHPAQATGKVNVRNLRWITTALLRSLEEVLLTQDANIPPEWKTIPDWKEQITAVTRTEYYDGLGIFRGVAKRHPIVFLANVWNALVNEPQFLGAQLLNGFAWSPSLTPDRVTAARNLIANFNASWPPQRVKID